MTIYKEAKYNIRELEDILNFILEQLEDEALIEEGNKAKDSLGIVYMYVQKLRGEGKL